MYAVTADEGVIVTGRAGRRVRLTRERVDYNADRARRLRENALRAKAKFDRAKEENDEAQKRLRELEKTNVSRLTTVPQLLEHARKCVRPGLQYFREKFIENDAPLKTAMDLYRAATVCDPTKLNSMTLDEAKVKQLKCDFCIFGTLLYAYQSIVQRDNTHLYRIMFKSCVIKVFVMMTDKRLKIN